MQGPRGWLQATFSGGRAGASSLGCFRGQHGWAQEPQACWSHLLPLHLPHQRAWGPISWGSDAPSGIIWLPLLHKNRGGTVFYAASRADFKKSLYLPRV